MSITIPTNELPVHRAHIDNGQPCGCAITTIYLASATMPAKPVASYENGNFDGWHCTAAEAIARADKSKPWAIWQAAWSLYGWEEPQPYTVTDWDLYDAVDFAVKNGLMEAA